MRGSGIHVWHWQLPTADTRQHALVGIIYFSQIVKFSSQRSDDLERFAKEWRITPTILAIPVSPTPTGTYMLAISLRRNTLIWPGAVGKVFHSVIDKIDAGHLRIKISR